MDKKYIAMRETTPHHGANKILEVIASTNLGELSKEMRDTAIPFYEDKGIMVAHDSRTVINILKNLSTNLDRTPLMKDVASEFDSSFSYKSKWGARGYARESHKTNPTFYFLNFPAGNEQLMTGLLYGHLNIVDIISLPKDTSISE